MEVGGSRTDGGKAMADMAAWNERADRAGEGGPIADGVPI